jgi:hypothetical protein
MGMQSLAPVIFTLAHENRGTCFLCYASVKVCSSFIFWYMPADDGSRDK